MEKTFSFLGIRSLLNTLDSIGLFKIKYASGAFENLFKIKPFVFHYNRLLKLNILGGAETFNICEKIRNSKLINQ